nr:hypothetical protein BgiMline_014989 [Biomphalaria glabrata]
MSEKTIHDFDGAPFLVGTGALERFVQTPPCGSVHEQNDIHKMSGGRMGKVSSFINMWIPGRPVEMEISGGYMCR